MSRKAVEIKLSLDEIISLNEVAESSHDPLLARRAKVILECNNGKSNKEISAITGMNEADVGRWRKAYIAGDGINCLLTKTNGGINQYGSPDKEIEEKLDILLQQDDASWSVKDLAEKIGCTENVVAGLLRKKGITLQRKRQWQINTQDELIPKNLDIIGLYLSHDEQAVVLCCAKDAVPLCNGEIVTRNRELYNDFNAYAGTVSLADAISTSVNHVQEKSSLLPLSLSDFLSKTISVFPHTDDYEYHILIHSPKTTSYRGIGLKGIFQNWADNSDEWLQIAFSTIEELTDRSRLNAVSDLRESITLYLEKCIPSSSPFIWKKVPVNQEQAVRAESYFQTDSGDNTSTFHCGTEHSPFLDDLREVLSRHISQGTLSPEIVKCGFISFAYDKDEIRLQLDEESGRLPNASDFSLASPDECRDSLTAVESALIKTRDESGVHAAEMAADLLKKKLNSWYNAMH